MTDNVFKLRQNLLSKAVIKRLKYIFKMYNIKANKIKLFVDKYFKIQFTFRIIKKTIKFSESYQVIHKSYVFDVY